MLRESSQAKGNEGRRMGQGKALSEDVISAGDLRQPDLTWLSVAVWSVICTTELVTL